MLCFKTNKMIWSNVISATAADTVDENEETFSKFGGFSDTSSTESKVHENDLIISSHF